MGRGSWGAWGCGEVAECVHACASYTHVFLCVCVCMHAPL